MLLLLFQSLIIIIIILLFVIFIFFKSTSKHLIKHISISSLSFLQLWVSLIKFLLILLWNLQPSCQILLHDLHQCVFGTNLLLLKLIIYFCLVLLPDWHSFKLRFSQHLIQIVFLPLYLLLLQGLRVFDPFPNAIERGLHFVAYISCNHSENGQSYKVLIARDFKVGLELKEFRGNKRLNSTEKREGREFRSVRQMGCSLRGRV